MEALIRHAAFIRLEAGHEWMHARLFGSQIAALKLLNGMDSLPLDNIKDFAAKYISEWPDELKVRYGFDGWLSFLSNNRVITVQDDRVSISELGRDLLRYMLEKRLSEMKPL